MQVGTALESIEIGTNAGHAFVKVGGRGISEANVSEEGTRRVEVYPNPASNYLSVEGAESGSGYEVRDLLGRKLIRGRFSASQEQISLRELPAGVYMILLDGQSQRILISRP